MNRGWTPLSEVRAAVGRGLCRTRQGYRLSPCWTILKIKIKQTHVANTNTYKICAMNSLMNILLKMPTAASVMQDATVHRVRRFRSLGKTQSMLYSFFTNISRRYACIFSSETFCVFYYWYRLSGSNSRSIWLFVVVVGVVLRRQPQPMYEWRVLLNGYRRTKGCAHRLHCGRRRVWTMYIISWERRDTRKVVTTH